MRRIYLAGLLILLSACDSNVVADNDSNVVADNIVSKATFTDTKKEKNFEVTASQSKKIAPNAEVWVGKPIDTVIDGYGVLDAPDLKKEIIKVGGVKLHNNLKNILSSMDREMGLLDVNKNNDNYVFIHGCSYRTCGSMSPAQFLIEYSSEWKQVYVCVTENGKTNTYSRFNMNWKDSPDTVCEAEMFYYGS